MRVKLLLVGIIILASMLRLYRLGDLPRGLYVDEVSLGYNAWSIVASGTDEHGTTFPLVFKAFGEYKLPVYIYVTAPFVWLFGLNPFSTRLVSALAGVASVIGIYLLTKVVLNNFSDKTKIWVALGAALLMATSPWSIHFSRAAFEANLALALIIFGTYFFLKFTQDSLKKTHNIILSGILFVVSLYTYNSSRVFLPLFITIIIFLFRKQLFNISNKTLVITSLSLTFSIIIISLVNSIIGNESARAMQVIELRNAQYTLGPLLGVIQKYFTHFSAEFLFFSGDVISRHSVREVGELFLPQLPFILVGFFILLKEKSASTLTLLSWILIAPLAAAITTPVPHALRSFLLLPPLVVLSSLGIVSVFISLRKYHAYIFTVIISICFIYSFITYMHVYYKHYIYKSSWDWDEDKTLLAQSLASDYQDSRHIFIEGLPHNIIYIKYFNAVHNQPTDSSKYVFFQDQNQINPQNGDVVGIIGWKGTPGQLQNVKEIIMQNNSIGYKVGEWKTNE